jgi:HK97 family phage major capsid protein
MKKEELIAMIKDVVGDDVADRVKAAVEAALKAPSLGESILLAHNQKAAPPQTEERGLVFAGVTMALAHAGREGVSKAIEYAKTIAKNDAVVKALEASTAGSGGLLIEPEVSSDIIELLRPRAVVRSFNPIQVPMSSGVLQIPRIAAATTAEYVGESMQPTISQPAFDNVVLQAKKLMALVPISNDLIRRAGSQAQTIVRNDVLRSLALKEDYSFIRAQGTQFTPKGIRYWAAPENFVDASAYPQTLEGVTAVLATMILKLEEANVAFTNMGWIFTPRTKMFLMTLRNALGVYAFRDEMMTGKFWGYPFRTTTQLPNNLGVGGDASEAYLVDFDDIAIGQTVNVEVAVSTEAAYVDQDGNLQSAFGKDQTLMRVIEEHDIAARHNQSIAVATGLSWQFAA